MILTASLQLDLPAMLTGGSSPAALNNGSPVCATDPFAQLLMNGGEAGPLGQSREPDVLAPASPVYEEVVPQLETTAAVSTALVAIPVSTSSPASTPPELGQQFASAPTSKRLLVEHELRVVQPFLPGTQRLLDADGTVARPGETQQSRLAQMADCQSGRSKGHQPVQQPLGSGMIALGSTPLSEQTAFDPNGVEGSKQVPPPEVLRTPGNETVSVLTSKAVVMTDAHVAEMPSAPLYSLPSATQAANASATAILAASAQLDLGQTIDRLVEARMAGRAAEVRLAVPHTEFGPVAIRLDPSPLGLAANLSSADPDFIPAVNAALAERIQAERVAADRALSPVEAVRADTAGMRGNEFTQNGRNPADASGSGTQHRSPPDSGSEARNRMRSGNESLQDGLVSGSQQRSPPGGLYA